MVLLYAEIPRLKAESINVVNSGDHGVHGTSVFDEIVQKQA